MITPAQTVMQKAGMGCRSLPRLADRSFHRGGCRGSHARKRGPVRGEEG
jgi:hypothetical protein